MKVKELLEVLNSVDPDTEVYISAYFEDDYNSMPGHRTLEVGKILRETDRNRIILEEKY